jgi:hypothetical protein
MRGQPRKAPVTPPARAADQAGLVGRRSGWLGLGVVLVLCIALLVVLRLRAGDPLGVRIDSWSEANILVSARNVAANGWARYGGVAQHQVDHAPFGDDPFYYYAQYPLGASYIAWAFYSLGVENLATLRWAPTLCSVASLLLWYALLLRIVTARAAVISTLVFGSTFGFLAFADDLHHGYPLALVVGMMLSYVAAIDSRGRRRHLLMALVWVLLLANSFMSWEWYLSSQMFFWAHALLVGVPFRKRWLLLFALAPLLALGVQHGVRVGAMGSEPGVSMLDDILRRTIRFTGTADTPADVTLWTYPLFVLRRFHQFYGIRLEVLLALVIGWGVAFGGLRLRDPKPIPALRWVAVFFLCSLTWWGVMLQHTAVHPHVMRHALFFYALALGVIIDDGVRVLGSPASAWWARAGAVGVVAYLVWAQALSTDRNVAMHTDRAYILAEGWNAGWSERDFFTDMAAKLPRDAVILTNYNRLPMMRYWTEQPTYAAAFIPYPFDRDQALPNARYQVEMATKHLEQLYRGRLPRLVYVYAFYEQPAAAYAGDPVLRLLTGGSWEGGPVEDGLARLREIAAGRTPPGAFPVVAQGRGWIAFDAAGLPNAVHRAFPLLTPPTRAEFGPPR